MTVAKKSFANLLALASETGCIGVEVRNDLGGALFDGAQPVVAGQKASEHGLRLLTLSEVSAFNDMSDRAFESANELATIAAECGADAINLIPRNDGEAISSKTRTQCLRDTLVKFAPVLEQHGVVGFIEPLGFEQSSLRSKSEVIDVLTELELTDRYKLVHDTFHHHLVGGGPVFPEHTGMVHVSGVVAENLTASTMRDDHRVLVDKKDVLNNLEQLSSLYSNGYSGPVSVEAFASEIHNIDEPEFALSECFRYIESNLAVATV